MATKKKNKKLVGDDRARLMAHMAHVAGDLAHLVGLHKDESEATVGISREGMITLCMDGPDGKLALVLDVK